MHITKRCARFALLLCSILSSASLARAADIAFFPVEAPNLATTDAVAVGELLAQSYASVSRSAVLAPSRTAHALAQSRRYEDAARALAVGEFVQTSALAVGRRIVVTATRYRVDGSFIYRSRLTADTAEDLVPVCERLAAALHAQRDDVFVRTHQTVTASEARAKNRLWREMLFGVRTGLHVPFAKGAKFSPAVGAEFELRLELAQFFLEFGAGLVIPTRGEGMYDEYDLDGSPVVNNRGSTGGLMAKLGASRFLTQGDVGLYAGAGLIPKIVFRNDSASMAAYAQLGITLPRASSTRFSMDLRFAQSVLAQHLNNDRSVFPSELSLHTGVGW